MRVKKIRGFWQLLDNKKIIGQISNVELLEHNNMFGVTLSELSQFEKLDYIKNIIKYNR